MKAGNPESTQESVTRFSRRSNPKGLLLLAFSLMVLSTSMEVRADDKGGYVHGFHLFSFEINQISAFQSGGNSFSGQVAWVPGFHLFSDFLIHLKAAGAIMKGKTSNFNMYDAMGLITWSGIHSLALEAGGGIEVWDKQETAPALSFVANYVLDSKILGIVDRIFIGYTDFLSSTAQTHEFKAGVGMVF